MFYTYWPRGKFPNLTHISLHCQNVRPSIDGFLDLLESTPYLEFLFLYRAGPRIAEPDLLPWRTISLPALRRAQFMTDSFDQFNITSTVCSSIIAHDPSSVGHHREDIHPHNPARNNRVARVPVWPIPECSGDGCFKDLNANCASLSYQRYFGHRGHTHVQKYHIFSPRFTGRDPRS